MNKHLTEEQLQIYAEQQAERDVAAHLQQCGLCRLEAENYRQVFSSLSALAAPAFEFDLSGMVTDRLPAPKQVVPWIAVAALLTGMVLIIFAAWHFAPYIIRLVQGLSSTLLAMLVAPVLAAVGIQALSYFKEHHQKLKQLETQVAG